MIDICSTLYTIYFIKNVLSSNMYTYIYIILFNTIYSYSHGYHFGLFQYELYPKHPILRGKTKKTKTWEHHHHHLFLFVE